MSWAAGRGTQGLRWHPDRFRSTKVQSLVAPRSPGGPHCSSGINSFSGALTARVLTGTAIVQLLSRPSKLKGNADAMRSHYVQLRSLREWRGPAGQQRAPTHATNVPGLSLSPPSHTSQGRFHRAGARVGEPRRRRLGAPAGASFNRCNYGARGCIPTPQCCSEGQTVTDTACGCVGGVGVAAALKRDAHAK